jgi:predicted transposase YbfD/YdcC
MNDSIRILESIQVETPHEGYVFDLDSLYERFEQLTDGRDGRGKRYALALILTLIVLAKLAGEHGIAGIAHWARLRSALLVTAFQLRRPKLPGHNTYRRVCSGAVEPSALQQVVSQALLSAPQAGTSVLISIDGKTLRGSWNKERPSGVHLLAAYLPAEGLVLMQVAVAQKTNEITAAPQVLQCLDLRGKVVIGDALHTQRALSAQIVASGADYVWYAKDNQPSLCHDIALTFQPEACGPGSSPVPTQVASDTQTDKAHGRIEKRTLTSSTLLKDYLDWPHAAQVFQLERQVWDLDKKPLRAQVVYGLTSLSAAHADPARLLELTRGYWGIENGLHYRRDVTLREDATRTRNARQAEVVAILNNWLVGVVLQQGWHNLAEAQRFYAANLAASLRLTLCHSG